MTTVTVVSVPGWRSEISTSAASTSSATNQVTPPPATNDMQSQKLGLGLGLGLGIPLSIVAVLAVLCYRRRKSRPQNEVYQLDGTSAGNTNSPQMADGTVKYEMNGAPTYQEANSGVFHELGAMPTPSELYSHR